MANGIVLSQSVRTNLLSLQDTTALQSLVQNRLATGKKVNSALDNPTSFFTAAGLNTRATELGALLDGMSNGIKTIEAADNAIKAITRNMETMQANIRQARQDKSWKGESFALNSARAGTISFTGGALATPTTFSVDPVAATPTTLTGVNDVSSSPFAGGTVTVNGSPVTIRGDVTAVPSSVTGTGGTNLTGDPDLSALTGQSVTLTPTGGGTPVTYTFTGSATGQGAALSAALGASGFTVARTAAGLNVSRADGVEFTVDSSNAAVATAIGIPDNTTTTNGTEAFDATAATVAADFTGAGITGLTATASGNKVALSLASGLDVALAGSDPVLTAIGFTAGANRASTNGVEAAYTTLDALVTSINADANLTGKIRATNDAGKLRIENLSTEPLAIGGIGALGDVVGTAGANTKTLAGNDIRKNLQTQFNDLRLQLDKLSDDASYNGVNLLRGDKLKVVFNEQGTSRVDIEAKNKTGAAGVSTAANSLDVSIITGTEYSSDDLLDARLDKLKASMTTLQTHASTLGSNLGMVQVRQEFTKGMINTLQTGADYLVNADMNEEGAKLLSLNTRQQLSQTALSLSSQSDQAVLRLFG